MKRLLICLLTILVLVGCSSGNESGSSSSNTSEKPKGDSSSTTVAEDLKDVAEDLKDVGSEIGETLTDTFNDAFGDLFSSSPDNSNETDTPTETQETVTAQQEEIEYIEATVDEMYSMLEDNALKAKKTYGDQYVEVTGKLGTIDSDGDYICLDEMNTAYSFYSVQCYIKNDEQLDYVLDMSTGKNYTVRVKITLVGEVLGYAGDIVEFVD